MNKVLLLKKHLKKMQNSEMVGQERLLDVNVTLFLYSW